MPVIVAEMEVATETVEIVASAVTKEDDVTVTAVIVVEKVGASLARGSSRDLGTRRLATPLPTPT